MQCSFGSAPSSLLVLPKSRCFCTPVTAYATIMDYIPIINILPFGTCTSPSNPANYATGSSPCIPAIVEPWKPGSGTVLLNNFKALSKESICQCGFQGIISIKDAGQHIVKIL